MLSFATCKYYPHQKHINTPITQTNKSNLSSSYFNRLLSLHSFYYVLHFLRIYLCHHQSEVNWLLRILKYSLLIHFNPILAQLWMVFLYMIPILIHLRNRLLTVQNRALKLLLNQRIVILFLYLESVSKDAHLILFLNL